MDKYINSDKIYLERKVTPTWQALSNILGCHFGNTVSGATQESEALGMKHRSWPQGSRLCRLFVGQSISKASAATQGWERAWNNTKVMDKPHLVNTGKKGEKYCQRDKQKHDFLPPLSPQHQTKKNSGG